MSPESGNLRTSSIREEAELIVEKGLERQAKISVVLAEIEENEFGDLRADLGYEMPEAVDRSRLTDTRVESMKGAIWVDTLKKVLVPTERSVDTILNGRRNVENILAGSDDRLIVIAGPCSIHDPEEALTYAEWLVGMREKYGDELEILMRTYLEKPRSEVGWKGLINDPNRDNTTDISLGLTMGRLLLCRITDMTVPPAMERVDARTTQYFDDLSVYDAIGARDSESTRARNYLSVTSAVGGAKNPTDGDMLVAVQAVLTARAQHTYLGDGDYGRLAEIKSSGNETVHVILRGGKSGPNYSSENVQQVKSILNEKGLPEIVGIDASHGNSGKDASRQKIVVGDIAYQIINGEDAIKLVMLESNLRAGQQKLKPGKLEYGVSVTDECVDLEETERMFGLLAGAVMSRRTSR